MDNVSFQLECKTAELNTVKAKIQELESTNAELRNTNFILGERIKLFEAANKKEVFEKYFPQSDTTNDTNLKPGSSVPHHQNCTSSAQHARQNCCPHHSCCYSPCSHPPSCGNNGPAVSSHSKYLDEQLCQLSSEIKELKTKIDAFTHQQNKPNIQKHNIDPTFSQASSQTPSQNSTNTPASPTINLDSSANTIDENVPSSPTDPLNYIAPTTQST